MKKVKGFARWFLTNLIFCALLYLYGVEGVQGAGNVLTAWIAVTTVLVTLLASVRKKEKINLQLRTFQHPVPPRVDLTFDLVFASALAWFDMPAMAILYLIHNIVMHAMIATAKMQQENSKTVKEEVAPCEQ